MATYKAPVDDMMFLFEKLRDNSHYNSLEKYKEVNPDLAKDILEQAAKLTENLILPLAKAGDEIPTKLENGVVITPPGYKEAYKNLLKMAGYLYLVIQNMAVKEYQTLSRHFLTKCFLLLVFLLNFIASLVLEHIIAYFITEAIP